MKSTVTAFTIMCLYVVGAFASSSGFIGTPQIVNEDKTHLSTGWIRDHDDFKSNVVMRGHFSNTSECSSKMALIAMGERDVTISNGEKSVTLFRDYTCSCKMLDQAYDGSSCVEDKEDKRWSPLKTGQSLTVHLLADFDRTESYEIWDCDGNKFDVLSGSCVKDCPRGTLPHSNYGYCLPGNSPQFAEGGTDSKKLCFGDSRLVVDVVPFYHKDLVMDEVTKGTSLTCACPSHMEEVHDDERTNKECDEEGWLSEAYRVLSGCKDVQHKVMTPPEMEPTHLLVVDSEGDSEEEVLHEEGDCQDSPAVQYAKNNLYLRLQDEDRVCDFDREWERMGKIMTSRCPHKVTGGECFGVTTEGVPEQVLGNYIASHPEDVVLSHEDLHSMVDTLRLSCFTEEQHECILHRSHALLENHYEHVRLAKELYPQVVFNYLMLWLETANGDTSIDRELLSSVTSSTLASSDMSYEYHYMVSELALLAISESIQCRREHDQEGEMCRYMQNHDDDHLKCKECMDSKCSIEDGHCHLPECLDCLEGTQGNVEVIDVDHYAVVFVDAHMTAHPLNEETCDEYTVDTELIEQFANEESLLSEVENREVKSKIMSVTTERITTRVTEFRNGRVTFTVAEVSIVRQHRWYFLSFFMSVFLVVFFFTGAMRFVRLAVTHVLLHFLIFVFGRPKGLDGHNSKNPVKCDD